METATFLNTMKATNNLVNGPRINDTNIDDIIPKDWVKAESVEIELINSKALGFNGD